MAVATKAIKTFSLDKAVLAEIKRTKGRLSESERVNRLLRSALELEKRAAFEQEAADFYATTPDDREERGAFESAGLGVWKRN